MENVATALELILTWQSILAMVIGTVVGVAVGVLPGLGSVVGITMVLPFTFTLPQIPAVSLMLGVYCGSVYGGSISAIVINTPGTPQAACTALDGFPMARRGEADLAIGWATLASVIGGLFSSVVLILAAPQLAAFALNFTPIEYFALVVFALTCIASVSRGAMIKGLLAGLLGLFAAVVGADPVTGDIRFDFGIFELSAGVGLIPTVVGLFALSEMFVRAAERHVAGRQVEGRIGFRLPPLAAWKPRLKTLFKSCLIGSFIGALPGTGPATSAFVAYSEVKRTSPNRDKLGTGEPEGIVAAESANNAVTGAALVPTLALGIPGDPATAVMLGTLVILGIMPGPRLFGQEIHIVYAIFLALIIINLVMFLVGALGAQLFTRVLRMPEPVMMTLVIVIAMIGSYGVRGNPLDLLATLIAGIVGFFLRYNGYPIAPLVIGLVLGPMVEESLRQGLIITRGSFFAFFERPIALVLFVLTALFLVWPVVSDLRRRFAR